MSKQISEWGELTFTSGGKNCTFQKPEYQIQMMKVELYSHYEPVWDCALQTRNKSLITELQYLTL